MTKYIFQISANYLGKMQVHKNMTLLFPDTPKDPNVKKMSSLVLVVDTVFQPNLRKNKPSYECL